MNYSYTREDIDHAVEVLVERYPKTFFRDPRERRPLKRNIVADILTDGAPLPHGLLSKAVEFYQTAYAYQYSLQIGVKRIDLHGAEGPPVTQSEQDAALKYVRDRQREQKEKREQREREEAKFKNPIEVVHKLHSDGKIPTDQLSKISAPPAPRLPMAKMKTPVSAPPTNSADLIKLRTLMNNIESVLATEDESLRAALFAPALKVLVAEANKLIALTEPKI